MNHLSNNHDGFTPCEYILYRDFNLEEYQALLLD